MTIALAVFAALLVGWVLVNIKTSRSDGELIRRVHPYRRLMAYIMPTRNESAVYFDTFARMDRLLPYIEEARKRFDLDITHCLVAAAGIGLLEVPKMNRFVSGRRLYQRKGRFITFSMKRKQLDREAKLAVVKLEILPGESFPQLCGRINALVHRERSGERTHADREYDLFSLIPRPLLNWAVKLLRWLDYHNLVPPSFIRHDAMYTSMFIANLGSVGMAPGYHHLYEWGNCPLFMMVGRIEERPLVVDGQLVLQKVLPIRWTYDERIDDGLNSRDGIDAVNWALENPEKAFGPLESLATPDAEPGTALRA